MAHAGAAFDVYHAIADETRRGLLDRLRFGEEAATTLSAAFRISQPAVSQHLRVLRDAGLVTERRAGRYRIYRLRPGPLKEVAAWIADYERFWAAKLQNFGRYLEPLDAAAPVATQRGIKRQRANLQNRKARR
jgi:DNA-binding transcriptional ArsR family regulator